MELEVAGHEVNFVSINKYDGVATQEEMVKHCAFPQLQDTEELDIWGQMGGGKDDFYIFDADGVLQTYFRFYGPISTILSEPDDYQTVKQAILSVLDDKGAGPERDAEADTADEEVPSPEADANAPPDSGPEPDAPAPPSDAQDAGEPTDAPPAAEDATEDVDGG